MIDADLVMSNRPGNISLQLAVFSLHALSNINTFGINESNCMMYVNQPSWTPHLLHQTSHMSGAFHPGVFISKFLPTYLFLNRN